MADKTPGSPKGSPGLAPGGRTAPATSPVAPSTPEPPKPTVTAKFYVDLFSTAFKAYQVKGWNFTRTVQSNIMLEVR